MGFGGGGSAGMTNHVHNSVPLQGGPLDFANDTIASLNVGSTTFSDGAALQELVIGNAGDSLVVNGGGTAPEWGATGGGATYGAKVRATDASKANDTTLADDDTLIIALAANKSYFFQCTMFINGNNSGHFKYAFSIPAGSGGAVMVSAGSGGNGIGVWDATLSPLTTSTTVNTPSSGVDGSIMVYGRVDTVGTADDFALQWAQGLSEPVPTYLLKGSSLVMWEG